RRDLHVADQDWHVGSGLDDASARGPRGDAACEDREAVVARFIRVAGRTIDHDTGDATQLRRQREVAAPACGLNTAALLEDDDVTGLRGLDRRGPEMARSGGTAIIFFKLHRDDTTRDPF